MPSLEPAGWLNVFWWCMFGGATGSFLNVVVYRLPIGLSLSTPPSHCPSCKNPIPWYDNVPVFGWIMLLGKCRHCHSAISIRYPLVEAVTTVMFGLMAWIGCLLHGSALFYIGNFYYLFLLCTLFCAGLIELDGNRPPWKLFWPALTMGAIAPWIWKMHWLMAAWPGLTGRFAVAANLLLGLVAGAVLGGIVYRMPRLRRPNGLALGLLCIGLMLGWQAVGALALATLVVDAVFWFGSPAWSRLRPPPSLVLMVSTLVWILVFSSLALR